MNASDGSLVKVLNSLSNSFVSAAEIAFDGQHVWVTNFNGTVSEIDPGTGSIVNTLTPAAYGFTDAGGIVFDGSHLWIADLKANTLTAVQGP